VFLRGELFVNKVFWLNMLDRVGWTFFQALGGAVAAGATTATVGTFDWRAALVGAATAAVLCALKVLGVNLGLLAAAGADGVQASGSPVQVSVAPAPAPTIAGAASSGAGPVAPPSPPADLA